MEKEKQTPATTFTTAELIEQGYSAETAANHPANRANVERAPRRHTLEQISAAGNAAIERATKYLHVDGRTGIVMIDSEVDERRHDYTRK